MHHHPEWRLPIQQLQLVPCKYAKEMLSWNAPRNVNFFTQEIWWKGFPPPPFFFLTHQNSEQGLRRARLGEGNTDCITLVNYLLCIPTANAKSTICPEVFLQSWRYSCEKLLCKRAESDSKTGKLLPLGSRAETTNISMKCQNSYAREEVTQNRDSARNWGLRHSVRHKTLTSTSTKEGKQRWGNKLYKLQLAALGRFFGYGGWGLATYV